MDRVTPLDHYHVWFLSVADSLRRWDMLEGGLALFIVLYCGLFV